MGSIEKQIREYIASHFHDRTMPFPGYLDEVMGVLRPLCIIAATGEYPLAQADAVNLEHVSDAIATAMGRAVKSVVMASVSRPFPPPDWMSAAVYQDHCVSTFWDEILASLQGTLGGILGAQYSARYGYDRLAAIRDVWQEHVGVSIGVAAIRKLGWGNALSSGAQIRVPTLEQRIAELGVIQGGVLVPYLAAATVGDTDVLENLYQLVLLLPEVLVLGERSDAPGVWIALAA
ncbi:MAG: hypothetical protein Q7S96_00825 [bacterium]|nr:hypothetical protein [bacterium]